MAKLFCGCLNPDYRDIELRSTCGDSFYCESSGECVDQSDVCNFHTDCPLGEDEGSICSEWCLLLLPPPPILLLNRNLRKH